VLEGAAAFSCATIFLQGARVASGSGGHEMVSGGHRRAGGARGQEGEKGGTGICGGWVCGHSLHGGQDAHWPRDDEDEQGSGRGGRADGRCEPEVKLCGGLGGEAADADRGALAADEASGSGNGEGAPSKGDEQQPIDDAGEGAHGGQRGAEGRRDGARVAPAAVVERQPRPARDGEAWRRRRWRPVMCVPTARAM